MYDSLLGQLLIAMPGLKDPRFEKSVILICEFSKAASLSAAIFCHFIFVYPVPAEFNAIAVIVPTSINVDVYIANGGTNYYLVKTAPIPSGGALQVLDGGAKIVVESGDRLYIKSDTASSVDAWVSAVDAIST